MSLPDVHALWVEGALSRLEQICLASFVKAGHRVVLHTYGKPNNLPADVAVFDAKRLIPAERIIRHAKSGSYALFSDIYRYNILKRFDCYWADTDVYCLKPFDFRADYVFAWQDEKFINGAVLRMPASSRMLKKLLALSEDPYLIPPWLTLRQRWIEFKKKRRGKAANVAEQRWGVLGPEALTFYVEKYALGRYALEKDVFYPVHWTEARSLFEPGFDFDRLTPQTRAVHLWNEKVKTFKTDMPQPGSFFSYAIEAVQS